MMRFLILVPICLTLASTSLCESVMKGRILALQMPIHSRWMVLKTLARELKEFGYKTTMVIPGDKHVEASMTDSEIDVIVSEGMTQFYSIFNNMSTEVVKQCFSGKTGSIRPYENFGKFCQYLVEDLALMETLQKRKFDMAVIDTLFVNLCLSVIPYKLSIPFIHYGRSFKMQEMRAIVHPGVYPATMALSLSDKMSYLQRVQNTFIYIKLMAYPDSIYPSDIVGTFAPEMPHLTNQQLQAKTELYLLETDELLDFHLPTTPDMKLIGGTETRPAEPLSGELNSFIDTATEGVVIVSLGSVVNHIPGNILNRFSEVFKRESNMKFVFRSGKNTKLVGNAMYMPWIPQNDLLGHKNTKIFITHCGDKGQFEALYHGVPMIGMPVLGNQPYNAIRMVRKGFGIQLNVVDFTPDMLHSAIQEMLRNSSYRKNIWKASEIFRNRPMPPGRRAAWWIDHVIKYGGDHLHSEAIYLPLYQFLLLDVFFGLCLVALLFISIFYMCFNVLCYVKRRTKQKKD